MKNLNIAQLVFALVLAALPSAARAEFGVSEKEILLGQSTSLTGKVNTNGVQFLAGSKLYFDKINAEGGVHGRQIRLITYDDMYDTRTNIENVKTLVEKDKVFALYQNLGASSAIALTGYIEKMDIPFFAPISSSEDVRNPTRKNYFHVRTSSAVAMDKMMAYAANEAGAKSFGMFYQSDSMGTGMRGGVIKSLHLLGKKLDFDAPVGRNTDDIDAILDPLIKANVDAVIIGTQPTAAVELIKKASARGYKPIYIGYTTLAEKKYIDLFDSSMKVYVGYSIPVVYKESTSKIVQDYMRDAKAAKQEIDALPFEGYLSAAIFVHALRDTGHGLTRDGFRKALERMKDVDFGGIRITYSPDDHLGNKTPFITTLKGNEFVPVEGAAAGSKP